MDYASSSLLAGLPGMPGTARRVRTAAQAHGWECREIKGNGGIIKAYRVADLPPETQAALALLGGSPKGVPTNRVARPKLPATLPAAPEAAPALPIPAATPAARPPVPAIIPEEELLLTDFQRRTRDARIAVTAAIARLVAETGCSKAAAMQHLVVGARAGGIDGAVIDAMRMAVAPRGRRAADGIPSVPTLKRWLGAGELTPRQHRAEKKLPPWANAFLPFYQDPKRPPLAEAYEKFMKAVTTGKIELSCPVPSIHQARRLIASMNIIDKNRGRLTGSAMKALKPYNKRDWSKMKSNDVWIGDGHGFKAKVKHPVHGGPFQPEVTFVMDAASRRIVGWSASFSESTIAVSDAIRHAQMVTRARPLIYYSDNGAGQTGKAIDDAVTGHLARQGIEHRTGIPGNPQGRGLIERLWPVTLIPLARKYDSCVWRGADKNYVTQMTKKLARKDGGGVKLPTWKQFLDDVEDAVNAYNSEHRKNRELEGMTPDEAYAAKLDPTSVVFEPGAPELESLWMPEIIRTPKRGKINLFGNIYFRRDLVERLTEGEEIIVRYDIHDKDKVWLFRMDGVYLGDADFEGNATNPFGETVIEQKRAERAAGKIRRAQAKIDEAKDEARPLIEMQPAAAPIVIGGGKVIDIETIRCLPANPETPAEEAPSAGQSPSAVPGRNYEDWLALDARIAAGEPVSEDDAWWHQHFPESVKYRTQAQKWAAEHEPGGLVATNKE
ncbi:MAG: Mu transposase C-terminal domain-containing protein [Zoogloeaceae bacterium]|jgi:putative transposase|nr:Mu transposase C-terminal domain-containing protein [Zoogloeaceae bacterium]